MGKGTQTRAKIVDEAIQLASVEGVTGLTIGRLAERTRMSKSGLFAHFKSKEEVEVAVIQEAIARFEETVIAPALAAPRGEPRIRSLVEHWIAWACDACGPGGCVLIQAASELDDRPGRARDLLAAAQRTLMTTLQRVAQGAIDARHLRRDVDPAIFAFQLYGLVLMTHQVQRLHDDPEAKTRLWRAVDSLIDCARITTARSTRRPRT